MANAELKTKLNKKSVRGFLAKVSPLQKRKDCLQILKMMKQATKCQPRMWGSSIVGFGDYHYKYASGREGDWFVAGFSPRKQNITFYLMSGLESQRELLAKLGKHKTRQSCLYIDSLEQVDASVLRKMIEHSVRVCKSRNG